MTEGVHIAQGRKAVQKGAFFGQKAGVLLVLLGPRQVDGLVGDVEVPADHDGLAFAAFFRIGRKGVEKAHLVGHALETAGDGLAVLVQFLGAAVGEIAVEEVELFKFQMQDAPFALPFRLGQFAAHGQRFDAAEHGHAGIAFFHHAGCPVGLPAFGVGHFGLELLGHGLGLLQADDIAGVLGEPAPFGFGGHGTQAVDVPGYESDGHRTSAASIAAGGAGRKRGIANGPFFWQNRLRQ